MIRHQIKVYRITEVRRNFSKIFNEVAVEGRIVEIRKRGKKESVYAVPCSLLQEDPQIIVKIFLRDDLSTLAANYLLRGAPENIIDAQIIDQKSLDFYQLSLLIEVEMPLDMKSRANLVEYFGGAFVTRFEKRYEIAISAGK